MLNEPVDTYDATPKAYDEYLLDSHKHLIVKHDLFNHDGVTQDGIAEAFIEFAKKEKLSFFLGSPFNKAKYEALLKGLEVSEIKATELQRSKRIDAEYYRPSFLKHELLIKTKKISLYRKFLIS